MLDGSIASSPQAPAPQVDPTQTVPSPAPEQAGGSAGTPAPVPSPAPTTKDISNSIRQAFGRLRQPAPSATPESAVVKPEGTGESNQTPESEAKPESEPAKQTLSPQEIERLVQAETDRREAARRKREQEEQRRKREAELRDSDPYAYAEEVKKREAEEQARLEREAEITNNVTATLTALDRGVLDPLFMRLPEKTQADIIDKIKEPGIEGRTKMADAALRALETHYIEQGKIKAREDLMNDPTFVKMVLARYGGQRIEPDVVTGAAAVTGEPVTQNGSFNNFIRGTRRR